MRLASLGARAAVLAAGLLGTATCQFSDALKPAGLEDITLSYDSDSVLVVAAPVVPAIGVTVRGAPFTGARLLLASSDTAIVAVRADTLVPKRRGSAVLTVTLQGSALPRNPPSVTRAVAVVADTVTLDLASVHLTSLGDTLALVATARDAQGAAIAGVAAAWSSSDTGVVAVSSAGRLTATGNGTATVRAMVDRDTAAAAVTVAQELVRWTFEPGGLQFEALTAAESVTATGHDARGNAISGLAPAGWSVGDTTIIALVGPGKVVSRANGSTHLYAVLGAVRDSASVIVAQRATHVSVAPRPVPSLTSVGDQVQLTARAFDSLGAELQGASPAWFTLDPDRARVSTEGLVTALAIGTARVVAALDRGADTASVSISNDPVSVTISPDSALATSVGDTLIFHAVARNNRGDPVATTVDWRTPDSAFVRLLPDGRAIALGVGTARIIAVAGATADTALAKVTNVPTAIDIAVDARLFTSLFDVDTLPVTITNARGAPLPRGSVTWSSDDATIARVNPIGVVTALDTGQTVVRAASGYVADSVVVTVQNVPAGIVIYSAPSADTLTALGQVLTLLTEVHNARGAPITGYRPMWRSTNRAVVDTVTPAGDALAVGWGTTLLIAQADLVADTVSLTVRNPTRLYVNNAPFSGLRVGTAARPYERIQDGVNAAEAGDTVFVLQGVGAYSESLVLARRVVLLGDSTAFVAGGRSEPMRLPLLAHDTGAAAISAYTTAPVAVKYLVVRHTLDGPAFVSDGSDVQLEWVYVNPPGTVTSRIGRGVLIRNSSSGTVLRHLNISMVRGYGISLVEASAAEIRSDSIIGVDSIGIPEGGAGVSLRGGSSVTVDGNVIRATRGPRILVRGAASATVSNHTFSGRHPLIQLDSVTGLVEIQSNTFQLGVDPSDAADSPDCSVDTRCAGVLITDSRNGALVASYPSVSYASPADISTNTFYDGNAAGTPGQGTAIRVRRSQAYGTWNTYRYIQTAYLLEGASKAYFERNTADTTAWLSRLQDVDTLYLIVETTHEAGVTYKFTEPSVGSPYIMTMAGSFNRSTGNLVNVWDSGANASFQQSSFTCAPNNQAIVFWGSTIMFYSDTVAGAGDSVPGYTAGVSYASGVGVIRADYTWLQNTLIKGFSYLPGLLLYGAIGSLDATQSVLTRNKVGLHIDAIVPSTANFFSAGNNAIFDNLVGGLEDARSAGSGLANWWWGDGRGPRGAANPAATGDSVLAAPTAPPSPLAAPPFTGTVVAAVRHVRGTGQTATAGSTLPKALTLRVVDAVGLPVPGVSVVFTVSAGGGNLSGQTTVTLATNGDGLAEAALTLGPAAGINTVTAAVSGLNTVTFTETGT
jgi:hypothetical protein